MGQDIHLELLDRFHASLKGKFRNWTCEELYYTTRLIGGPFRRNDHFVHGLRSKLILFLRQKDLSNENPLSVDQWGALREHWVFDYLDFLAKPRAATEAQIEALKARFS